MSDYEFIKEFNKITLTSICDKLKLNRSNLSAGKAAEGNYKKVKYEIIMELLNILKKDKGDMLTVILYNELLEKVLKENKNLKEML